MIDQILARAREDNLVRAIDFHIGMFMEKLHAQATDKLCPELRLAATLTSMAVGGGHVCLPLEYGVKVLPAVADLLPPLQKWRKKLLATRLVGHPGEDTPLILDEKNRLYFYRYYQYEEIIASSLARRAAKNLQYDAKRAANLLSSLFPDSGPEDDQKNAVTLALQKPLVIISGGPGTGKTHTVARILAAILALNNTDDQGKDDKPLRIALTAPTGKAAARLEESIRKAKDTIASNISAKELIPEKAQTLHRLLGYQPVRAEFKYHKGNLLHLDLVVLDEASMIDMSLMAALVEALPEKTRIILLGDRNQLTSVEAGNLFSDLCFAGGQRTENKDQRSEIRIQGSEAAGAGVDGMTSQSHTVPILSHLLENTVVNLGKSYRFHESSGISLLAKAVNDGDPDRAEHILGLNFADLDYHSFTDFRQERQWLMDQMANGYAAMAGASSLSDGFAYMERFRIICAVRRGSNGTEEINRLAEQSLHKRERGYLPARAGLYMGKPIIIRKNHYGLQLFNGDTGLLWRDESGQLMAWFKRKDNSFFQVTPARLPAYDPGFAITIHQSQGSEFAEVLLIMPADDNRVLSRELFYTGITRARNKLLLFSRRNILFKAINRCSVRYSGLTDMISAHGGWDK